MSLLPDDKKIILINIPATHDSAAYYMNSFLSCFSKTQYYSIKEQLELGIRKFDIRITKSGGDPNLDEDIICCHGICDCYISDSCMRMKKLTYKSILLDMRNFLEENPKEMILIGTSLGRGDGIYLKRGEEIFNKYVGDISLNYDPNYTLGQVRGKIINDTYLHEENNLELKKTIVRSLSRIRGVGIDDVHKKYHKCKTFQVCGTLKIKEMRDMFDIFNMTFKEAENAEKNDPEKFPITYSISCTGEYKGCLPYPERQANIVNHFILENNVFLNGHYYGWINMDFVNLKTVKKIIDTNFQKVKDKIDTELIHVESKSNSYNEIQEN